MEVIRDKERHALCSHGRQLYLCKECGGKSFCEHGLRKWFCVACGGTQICQHKKRRSVCKACGGSEICEHSHRRDSCGICKTPAEAYRKYKDSAKRLGRSFSLAVEQFTFIVSQPCDFCGESEKRRGVDRWDNNIGYEFVNCRPCCAVCNFLKGDKDGPMFVEHCQRIAAHTLATEDAEFQQFFSFSVSLTE